MIRAMVDAATDLPDDLLAWIGATAGGEIVEVRRQARWRPTYFIDVAAPDVRTTVLKMARAPRHVIERSALLSTFNTEREALVLRALQGSEVRVPPYLGINADTGSLLMEKVEGSAQVHEVDRPRPTAHPRARLRGADRGPAPGRHRTHHARRRSRGPDVGRGRRARQLPRLRRDRSRHGAAQAARATPIRCWRSPAPGPTTGSRRSTGRRVSCRATAAPTSSCSPVTGSPR